MGEDPLVSVSGLEKHYPIREGLLRRQTDEVRAVDGVDFEVGRGEIVGLIGESGCGKSTAASTLLRLEEPTGGSIEFDGDDLLDYDAADLRAFRRDASMVFQNPTDSFDPKMTIGESVAEPLRIQGVDDASVRASVVQDLLARCGLPGSASERYPHELSDGQKQRAALARALVVDPDLLVADEPVSALDMSIQAEILTLLSDLQADLGISMLVISHDIGVVRELCDRVYVMYLGEIVEEGETERILADPKHPYTRALVDAVPVPDPRQADEREPLAGEIPDAANPPAGCRFHPRCPAVVPPETLDVDSETYRGVLDLREELAAGDLDADAVEALGTDGGGSAHGDGDVGDGDGAAGAAGGDPSALDRTLRAAHGLPSELADETAEAAVSRAIESAAAGDPEGGAAHLRDAFESVCERDNPEMRAVDGDGAVACHLYGDASGD